MKYHNETVVWIPIVTDDGKPSAMAFRFNGTVDKRRIRRTISKFLKANYNTSYKKEQYRVLATVLNNTATRDIRGNFNTWLQNFIDTEKELVNENKDQGYTYTQAEYTGETVVPLRPVFDQSEPYPI